MYFSLSLSLSLSLFLSPVLTAIFHDLKQRMMEGGGDNWTIGAISHAKLQSNHHHNKPAPNFFYRPDVLPVAQPTVSKH